MLIQHTYGLPLKKPSSRFGEILEFGGGRGGDKKNPNLLTRINATKLTQQPIKTKPKR